jgi:hypothetical protein
MKFVTVISDKSRMGFYLLKVSCSTNNLPLDVLVYEQQEYKNNRIKDYLIRDYAADLHSDELIFFTDGYDTIFMAGEDEITRKFLEFKKDLVFSAETACWPDQSLAAKYPVYDNSPYKYLNSGGFIGKAGFIKELLNDNSFFADEKFEYSNQYLWAHLYLRGDKEIGLDSKCNLFCTFSPEIGQEHFLPEDVGKPDSVYGLAKLDWFSINFVIKDGRIFNKITGTWACNAHFNGESKCLLMSDEMLDMLFMQIPNSEKINLHHIKPF